MIESQHLDRLPGMNVVGADGEDIGNVDEVYVDDATGKPSFALINTGLFGLKSSFVPLDRAAITGEALTVAYNKDRVKDAPKMDPDGHLNPDEEDELYAPTTTSTVRISRTRRAPQAWWARPAPGRQAWPAPRARRARRTTPREPSAATPPVPRPTTP